MSTATKNEQVGAAHGEHKLDSIASTPFRELGLSEPMLKSLELSGYTKATPIQAKAIPVILSGRDVLGIAQTGTGKTAAFALPVLQKIAEAKAASGSPKSVIRCLVLVPTRELALQVNTSFNKYGRQGIGGPGGIGVPLRFATIFGGVAQHKQVEALRSGIDVLVATPGRLEDLIQQGHVNLSTVSLVVLDEADQMLDMGFIIPVRRITKLVSKQRQTLMFSATMPREIKQLAEELLTDYAEVSVAPAGTTAAQIDQKAYVIDQKLKGFLLRHYIKEQQAFGGFRTLVFTRTKHGADRVARGLQKSGITALAIHGNRSQSQRVKALEKFKKGEIAVLVATDVAARGLHISDVSHVVNFDLPEVPDTYVHRIGRTGRAGASGVAVSFVDREDRFKLKAVERLLKKAIEIVPTPDLKDAPENDRADGDFGYDGEDAEGFDDRDESRDDRAPRQRTFGDRPQFNDRPSFNNDRPAFNNDRPRFNEGRGGFGGDRRQGGFGGGFRRDNREGGREGGFGGNREGGFNRDGDRARPAFNGGFKGGPKKPFAKGPKGPAPAPSAAPFAKAGRPAGGFKKSFASGESRPAQAGFGGGFGGNGGGFGNAPRQGGFKPGFKSGGFRSGGNAGGPQSGGFKSGFKAGGKFGGGQGGRKAFNRGPSSR